MQTLLRLSFALVAVCGLLTAPAHAQVLQDVVTVGTVSGTGPTVSVPVYIRDTSGTPLGIDQPSGSRIQAFSIKVDFPTSPNITNVTFTRAGITAPLTPLFESNPTSPGSTTLIASFFEPTNLIPFTSNAALPGNQIGQVNFTFAPSTPAGFVVPLTIDATLTQLSNQAGTTSETTAGGTLAVVPGSVTVTAPFAPTAPTLSTWALGLLAAALAVAALRLKF
ncbi:MAG: IPTL-CTERM sorting domain-containing protein [Acidobacteria bacterium]|nr:IPTL-CTERM sorting domain-containing protein [Acidobacteriota bacterium]